MGMTVNGAFSLNKVSIPFQQQDQNVLVKICQVVSERNCMIVSRFYTCIQHRDRGITLAELPLPKQHLY